MIFEENNSSYFIFISGSVIKFFDETYGCILKGNISLNKNIGGSINFFNLKKNFNILSFPTLYIFFKYSL